MVTEYYFRISITCTRLLQDSVNNKRFLSIKRYYIKINFLRGVEWKTHSRKERNNRKFLTVKERPVLMFFKWMVVQIKYLYVIEHILMSGGALSFLNVNIYNIPEITFVEDTKISEKRFCMSTYYTLEGT